MTEAELLELHALDINCERPLATCPICKELWFRGTCSTPRSTFGQPDRLFCFHDEAEHWFWRHAKQSPRHQALLTTQGRRMLAALAELPDTIAAARAHQKLMRNPTLAPLRRLFR